MTTAYEYSDSLVFVAVATGGAYTITDYRGSGGCDIDVNGPTALGGKAAKGSGAFTLTAGEHLEITFGGAGKNDTVPRGTLFNAAAAIKTFIFSHSCAFHLKPIVRI